MSAKDNGFAAVKAAMMPQIDAALDAWLVQLSTTMEAASAAEIDRCIGIVEGCAMVHAPSTTRESATGRAGWNEAIRFAADRLREWKTAASTPNGGDPRG
jgi:hypothetical protein